MAEFKEVIKQKKRMCEKYYDRNCVFCPLVDIVKISCDVAIIANPQEAEKLIMKWAEENRPITNADKFKEVFGVDVNRNKCLFGHSEECKKHLTCYSCHLTNWWNEEYVEPDKE